MGVVVGDISSRRGVLETTEDENNYKKIVCYIPFAEIIGYIKTLRELTKGQGSYDATLHSYEKLPGHLLEALRKTKGVL
jgi:elongation factor G